MKKSGQFRGCYRLVREEVTIGPVGQGDCPKRRRRVQIVGPGQFPRATLELGKTFMHRCAGEPSFDGRAIGFDRFNQRRRKGQATVELCQKTLKPNCRLRLRGSFSQNPEDMLVVQPIDEGFRPCADKIVRRQAIALQNGGDPLIVGQLTVFLSSGRSSEKAGTWISKASPVSVCIW